MPVYSRNLIMAFIVPWALLQETSQAEPPVHLNLAEFGRLTHWLSPDSSESNEVASVAHIPAGARCVGVIWQEARDVREIRLQTKDESYNENIQVQYWFRTWPPPPPAMPTIEDPEDDEWQGRWLNAAVSIHRDGKNQIITFAPLDKAENPLADHLPGVNYRRTLKLRVVFPNPAPPVEVMSAFSESVLQPLSLRIELGCSEPEPADWNGRIEVFNGRLISAHGWNFSDQDSFSPPASWSVTRPAGSKGILLDLLASRPKPAGSNDITVVTVRATAKLGEKEIGRTFSFSTSDLEREPIYVRDFFVYVTKADDDGRCPSDRYQDGRRIRQQIPLESEQTFERASREIPPQDPWVRQYGDKVYLPVAADASWQKFAVEYGGHVFMSRGATKAKGAEAKRLRWAGDTIRYRFGTGKQPYYRDDRQAKVSVAEENLPIIINRWEQDELHYEQEAFATLLEGPLDPNDPARNEQTPAVLMMAMQVHNPGGAEREANIRVAVEPGEVLELSGRRVLSRSNSEGNYETPRLRAVLHTPVGGELSLVSKSREDTTNGHDVVARFTVPAGGTQTLFVAIPFVSDVSGADADKLEALSYPRERKRVADYWRTLIDKTTRFSTPEPKFNYLARFVVPHIHISTTKDPKSGLYMVPAASYHYPVFANEACFQVLMLDALGDTERATQYLQTLTDLQGTRSFPGNYPGPYDGVFHGAKVSKEYDYTASDYGLDHGTVLWTLARHYFYTRDADWLKRMLPHMFKAIEWIERQRAATKRTDLQRQKVLEFGLLPAGHLEDNSDWGYWFAVNAYCVAGMLETAAAMRDIGHDETERYERQAAEYRTDFRNAVLRSSELAPVTRMRDGTYSPYVPTRVHQRFRGFGPLRVQYYNRYNRPGVLPCYRLSATREVLYGPMILLNLQIFDPNEPIADWILDDWEDNLTLSSSGGFNVHGFTDDRYWFSQGGMVFQSNLQNPILVYLMRHEIPAAIRGLYNGFVACLYPEVNTLTEEYREWGHASGPFYKSPDEARFVNRLRDTLVLESGDELHLAGGIPRRWTIAKDGVSVDRVNSYFGPLGFKLRPGTEPNTITAEVTPPARNKPSRAWLHVRLPQPYKMTAVILDGKEWSHFDPTSERIELPQGSAPMQMLIRYRPVE